MSDNELDEATLRSIAEEGKRATAELCKIHARMTAPFDAEAVIARLTARVEALERLVAEAKPWSSDDEPCYKCGLRGGRKAHCTMAVQAGRPAVINCICLDCA